MWYGRAGQIRSPFHGPIIDAVALALCCGGAGTSATRPGAVHTQVIPVEQPMFGAAPWPPNPARAHALRRPSAPISTNRYCQ